MWEPSTRSTQPREAAWCACMVVPVLSSHFRFFLSHSSPSSRCSRVHHSGAPIDRCMYGWMDVCTSTYTIYTIHPLLRGENKICSAHPLPTSLPTSTNEITATRGCCAASFSITYPEREHKSHIPKPSPFLSRIRVNL